MSEIKANMEWINREWRRFLESPRGKQIAPGEVKVGPQHLAKLFAAFCLDRLRMESEAEEAICGGTPEGTTNER